MWTIDSYADHPHEGGHQPETHEEQMLETGLRPLGSYTTDAPYLHLPWYRPDLSSGQTTVLPGTTWVVLSWNTSG